MPEQLVVCGGLQTRRRGGSIIELDVDAPGGSPSKVNLGLPDLSRRMADNIPDVLADLLEIAAYVYCADQFTRRGSDTLPRMGAAWRRRFRFLVPVRCPEIWNSDDVRATLVGTLGFLTEDEFAFEFSRRLAGGGLEPYLGFGDPSSMSISPDEIILFSGGLDSLAGAVDALIGNGKRVILVSHQSSTMVTSKQRGLIAALRGAAPSRALFHVPVDVNTGRGEPIEFTQRSRSFLFAALGLVVARMFDLRSVSFYENGIVSLNLSIAEHVLGARASRTTHPRFLADCARLFSLLLLEPFSLENPYLWKTKRDVVLGLADHGASHLIDKAFSCTRVREATRRGRHCGTCSQCIDRRFAVLAAGLAEHEPADVYSIDLFRGEHKRGTTLTMIESYVTRARKLATISEPSFLASFGQVFRALPYLQGPADDCAR